MVTARRRAEDASKVPIAITAFSGEQLVAKGITSAFELTKITPGLNITGGGGKSNPFVVIRGQSKAVTGNGSPGVITYLNDVPLPSSGAMIQTFDMENFQVLKGPQGTLFGRNSIGGALLAVTKAPDYTFSGYVRGEIAEHDFKQIEGAINIPIVNDRIALRVAAQVGHVGGDFKTYHFSPYSIATNPDNTINTVTPGQLMPGGRNVDEFANQSYRVSLLIEPTDWIKNVTVADYTHIRGSTNKTTFAVYPQGFRGNTYFYRLSPQTLQGFGLGEYAKIVAAVFQCPQGTINCNIDAAAAANSADGRYNFVYVDPWASFIETKGISNTTTIQLGDNHRVRNIASYRTTRSFFTNSLTGLAVPLLTSPSAVNMRQITEELQVAGSFFDNTLTYTVGGFLFNEQPNGVGGYQALEVNAFGGLSHNIATTYLRNSSRAVYGQVDYSLDSVIPGLTLTAGLRQTWDTQSACTTATVLKVYSPQQVFGSSSDVDTNVSSEDACLSGNGLIGPAGATISRQVFGDAKFNKLTYTFGANWQITPDAMIYVTRRRGYRAGGYNTPILDPFLADVQTFRPETLTDWEVGAKLRFHSGSVHGSLDVAAFSGKDKGNQLPINTSNRSNGVCVPEALGTAGHPGTGADACTTTVGGQTVNGSKVFVFGATTTANAADLTIRGIEIAASLSPFPGVTFSGSAAYVDIKTDSVYPSGNLDTYLRAANIARANTVVIQGQPKWNYNAAVSVDYPNAVLGGRMSADLSYHYNGSYRQVEIDVPAWNSLDLRVALDNIGDTGVSVAAYAKNLLDSKIYEGTASSSFGTGAGSYIMGRSRTAGVQLAYTWGNR